MGFLKKQPHKLSHRWGQLFSTFLVEEEKPASADVAAPIDSDSTDDLLDFMQQTIKAHHSDHAAAAGPACRILFVSEDNAARTQIASAYTRYLGGEQAFVRSVGLSPAYCVDPVVIEVLKERGVPTEDLKPKTFNPHSLHNIDEVISFGANTKIGNNAQTWTIPKNTDDKALVHRMCDEVEAHVRQLLTKLGIEPRPHSDLIPEFMAA
ncbi:phosphotyrosine protein phosphatase [Corynebacterium sp. HS2168-gen11]|uniref:arsenate reductase/protein-tyrosine-phosphatase family protein n=1 Tax=Corynebacterium sp. HS2168-gen11 TaxID=2974027 RepID=UPI00216AC548|nr:phosphotyrosine protein phosphatase [Corynebacterium sp. HS2168-gen11]MCS4536001.1 phosphotyrosine protein phosphatase [Corynebacterium sp. HS2168-gen11]